MEFLLNLKDPRTYFLFFVFLVISWIIFVETRGIEQTELEPEEPDSEPELEQETEIATSPTSISGIQGVIKLSLCSKHTANCIKLFKRSYFKGITNCKIEFMEDRFCRLEFSTPSFSKKYSFFDTLEEECVCGDNDSYHCYFQNKMETTQTFATQFLEISDCCDVKMTLHDRTALERFVHWGQKYESSLKSVQYNGRNTIFDLVNYFTTWKKVVLIHTHHDYEYHLNQKSISIISCDQGLLNLFWELPHQSIHFSKDAFDIYSFIGYIRRWIASSIPCTELVDFTAELHLPNYFDSTLRSVKFEVIDEEWIHPIHGKILPPHYKIQRIDQRKCALLFTFDKDGEPCLGMNIY
ncbi:unnamed protein product [Caenorhabditis brenneri]